MQTFENETDELAHVWIDDEEIVCTPGHKFYSPKKGWTDAIDLKCGDMLQLLNGSYVVVEYVQHEILEYPVKIYNFEVEDFHTYYVGQYNSVLVHNLKCIKTIKQNGVKIESYYPNDHGNPVHLHVKENGPSTKIGPNGYVVKGYPKLSSTQSRVVESNLKTIKKSIKTIQKWIRKQ